MQNEKYEKAKSAVITVGSDRGFVIEHGHDRYVVTAAHCLPRNDEGLLPIPAVGAIAPLEKRTYRDWLAPLGSKPAVWVECRFVDPVADIAVLCSPDTQVYSDESDAYDDLVNSVEPINVVTTDDVPKRIPTLPLSPDWTPDVRISTLLLSLDGSWIPCTMLTLPGGPLCPEDTTAKVIKSGMSGSPIISEDGTALGVVANSHSNPRLACHLPGWILRGSAEVTWLRLFGQIFRFDKWNICRG